MKKRVATITSLFLLLALAFVMIGCDGTADKEKVDEMLGTNVKLNGTWKSQSVTYTHDGKQYTGHIELRFNDDQMQIVAPYGTSKIHRYTRNGIVLNITDSYVDEDNPYRTAPFPLEFDSTGFSVDLGELTFMTGAANIKLNFTKTSDGVSLKEPDEKPEEPEDIGNKPEEPSKIIDDVFVVKGNILTGLTDYGKTLETIVIPTGVTKIGKAAFESCGGLTSVTIPDGVTSIGDRAFDGCSGLTSVTIPDDVTSIGFYAFSRCSGLTSITIPDNVTSISDGAFASCSGLISIKVSESNSNYTSVDGVLMNKEKTRIVIYPGGKSGDYIISDGITEIGDYAFSGCSGLTSITIPDGVTEISECAFSRCSGLTSITIPDSVTDIDWSAFSECSGLTSVTIPDGVTYIAQYAFHGCSGLTSITIPDSVTKIRECAFYECRGLTYVTIGSGVTFIENRAFEGCSGLTDIYINQAESNLIANANVPSGCTIHWNSTGPESV